MDGDRQKHTYLKLNSKNDSLWDSYFNVEITAIEEKNYKMIIKTMNEYHWGPVAVYTKI